MLPPMEDGAITRPQVRSGPTPQITEERLLRILIKESSGFTFFGVVIVVLLSSLFAGVLYMSLSPVLSSVDSETTIKKMDVLKKAIEKYKYDSATNSTPALLDHLVNNVGPACVMDTVTSSSTYRRLRGWCGPYVDQYISQAPNDFKTDGWGTVFQYNGSVLTSCGPNRTCGDGDDIVLPLT